MPNANVSTATSVNPGLRRSARPAYRRSWRNASHMSVRLLFLQFHDFPQAVAGSREVTKASHRFRLRVVLAHSAGAEFGDAGLDMEREFLFSIGARITRVEPEIPAPLRLGHDASFEIRR